MYISVLPGLYPQPYGSVLIDLASLKPAWWSHPRPAPVAGVVQTPLHGEAPNPGTPTRVQFVLPISVLHVEYPPPPRFADFCLKKTTFSVKTLIFRVPK